MVGDPGHQLCNQFDLIIPKAGISRRATIIINPQGEVEAYEISGGGMGRNADELLRKVQAGQFMAANPGVVCPAKWKPGAETINVQEKLAEKVER